MVNEPLQIAFSRTVLDDYAKDVANHLVIQDVPFAALIAAAMARADTANLLLLQVAFPLIYEEIRR